jgi:CHRD domain
VSYDTTSKNLTWTITYSGLTGDATAAHFHGPADTDKTAGIAVPITGDLKRPVKGSATLTDAQAADLLAGRYYLPRPIAPARSAGKSPERSKRDAPKNPKAAPPRTATTFGWRSTKDVALVVKIRRKSPVHTQNSETLRKPKEGAMRWFTVGAHQRARPKPYTNYRADAAYNDHQS